MYDIHCHILPGLDDGADFIGDSLRMMQIAAEGGTAGIICTPHCNIPGRYENHFDEGYLRSIDMLRKTAAEYGIKINLYSGAEVFLAGAVLRLLRDGRIITLNDSDYLLCEFHPNEHPDSAKMKIESICAEGYIPIVAHPERCRFVCEIPMGADILKSAGALLQINKDSLNGSFGSIAKKAALKLIEEHKADFIASDAHSPFVRTPYLRDAYETVCALTSAEYANYLFKDNPLRVIGNEKIYSFT